MADRLTLEASELPALDLWFAPPLLSSCLLQSCYMIITHGTQHDHTSSSELNRNMFAGALHDNFDHTQPTGRGPRARAHAL